MRIWRHTISERNLRKLPNRERNQLFGCMHAHNELTALNRLLMFSMNDTTDGDLHIGTASNRIEGVNERATWGSANSTPDPFHDPSRKAHPPSNLPGISCPQLPAHTAV